MAYSWRFNSFSFTHVAGIGFLYVMAYMSRCKTDTNREIKLFHVKGSLQICSDFQNTNRIFYPLQCNYRRVRLLVCRLTKINQIMRLKRKTTLWEQKRKMWNQEKYGKGKWRKMKTLAEYCRMTISCWLLFKSDLICLYY